jgi:hypothetical protein
MRIKTRFSLLYFVVFDMERVVRVCKVRKRERVEETDLGGCGREVTCQVEHNEVAIFDGVVLLVCCEGVFCCQTHVCRLEGRLLNELRRMNGCDQTKRQKKKKKLEWA